MLSLGFPLNQQDRVLELATLEDNTGLVDRIEAYLQGNSNLQGIQKYPVQPLRRE
jgi:hypothetical protein